MVQLCHARFGPLNTPPAGVGGSLLLRSASRSRPRGREARAWRTRVRNSPDAAERIAPSLLRLDTVRETGARASKQAGGGAYDRPDAPDTAGPSGHGSQRSVT